MTDGFSMVEKISKVENFTLAAPFEFYLFDYIIFHDAGS